MKAEERIRKRRKPMRRLAFWLALAGLLAAAFGAPAAAQDYPSKPVTFVTPAAAGNSPDVITRLVADRLTRLWKQQVVVINRPGAGGLIAAQAAAALPNDGYSIYMTQASTYTVLPIQQGSKMPVDLDKAFVAVGMVGEQPIALGVQKDVKAKNVAELVELANKTPGGLFFAATNRGGQAHLTGELFRDRAKANISFVHAAGAAVSLNDVIAGRIPMMFEGLAGLTPGTESGDIRLLGIAAAKRLPNLPNLPTIAETVPGVVSTGWVLMMAPAGVPDAIVQKLNRDLRTVVAQADLQERFHQLGTYTRDLSPAETQAFIRSEEKLWWPIVERVEAQK
jgi:tripartite-type tricarboxylate transporter receptor subunit TctC